MSKLKAILLTLSLVLILSLSITGCSQSPPASPTVTSSPTPTTTTTQQTLTTQDIVANTIAASAKADILKLKMDMSLIAEAVGGSSPGTMTMSESGSGYINTAGKEMTLNMAITMDIPGQGTQNVAVDMYILNGWAYAKTNMPGVDEQWSKMKVTDDLWTMQSALFEDQLNFLKTALDISSPGTESVEGVDSYIIKITPGADALSEWIGQMAQQSGIQFSATDVSKLINNVSMKIWVAKDTYLPAKQEMSITMETLPGDVGASASEFDKMTMTISSLNSYYDYGKQTAVQLPPEAANAQEVPTS